MIPRVRPLPAVLQSLRRDFMIHSRRELAFYYMNAAGARVPIAGAHADSID